MSNGPLRSSPPSLLKLNPVSTGAHSSPCLETKMGLRPSHQGISSLADHWSHFPMPLPLTSPLHYCTDDISQALVHHFWKRWSSEYLVSLRSFSKWHHSIQNPMVGDVVVLHEDNTVTAKWPLTRITQVHSCNDGVIRVVTLKTSPGIYTQPVTKIIPLLSYEP